MKKTINILALTASVAVAFSSCSQSAGSFSVLSESSSFQQQAVFTARKIDVLFVVDNSGSMQSSQTNLANNFSTFIDRFITKGYDFKIAVTTSEAYRYTLFSADPACTSRCTADLTKFRTSTNNVYIIDQANYDLTQASEKARLKNDFTLNSGVGTNGSGDERVLSSFKSALADSQNAGFHRPDAFLAIVILSDEEDFSSSSLSFNESYSNPALFPVSSYKTFLDGFTSGVAGIDYSVSTIVIQDTTCQATLGAGKKIANRVLELADLTGGSKNSLCDPFDTSLDNISAKIEGQGSAQFVLTKNPIVSSIRLIINNVSVPQSATEGWTYTSATKTVKVNGSIYKPANGAIVKLNFDPDLNNP